jgi:hypothetical protein
MKISGKIYRVSQCRSQEIITSILYEEDFNEELKLKLMEAFSINEIDSES